MDHGYIDDPILLGEEYKWAEYRIMKSGYTILEITRQSGRMHTIPVSPAEDVDSVASIQFGIESKNNWLDFDSIDEYVIQDNRIHHSFRFTSLTAKVTKNFTFISYRQRGELHTRIIKGQNMHENFQIDGFHTRNKWRKKRKKVEEMSLELGIYRVNDQEILDKLGAEVYEIEYIRTDLFVLNKYNGNSKEAMPVSEMGDPIKFLKKEMDIDVVGKIDKVEKNYSPFTEKPKN